MIQVIGDSHSCFFGGCDKIYNYLIVNYPFSVRYLCSGLAYNIGKPNTTSQSNEKLIHIFDSIFSSDDQILFVFGEIDCRYHLLNQSKKQNIDIKIITEECVDRYVSAIKTLNKKRYIVGVWAPIASTWLTEEQASINRWILGDCLDRNKLTLMFGEYLKERCKSENIYFFSIFNDLILPNGETNPEYYMDSTHLSQKAMLFAKESLKAWLKNYI